MKATNFLLRQTFLCFVLAGSVLSADDLVTPHQVKQTPEVVEAYRVCETFEHVLGENLDFDRAYEATFTKDVVRRRAIAIADGEFGDQDFASMDDKLVIKAYKLRMQILYLMLPLAGPSDEEAGLFFPPDIKEILQRKVSNNSRGFRAYVSQLERDVVRFRSHLELLTSNSPSVAERVRNFKSEALSASVKPPGDRKIEPMRGSYKTGVLGRDEAYYEIESCIVARDQGKMRMVGLRFFYRLF